MPYPRLHRDFEDLVKAPPVYRMADFAGRDADGRHEAERAVERVQRCLDKLDEMLDPLPFQRSEYEDTGPYAA